ncbi:hypothetical protein [Phenylobacterium sp.]|uniref:hypothetical protein n=1 Tax=Phenylobacterium sp. TaxID=1871053 RepID=UPI00121D78DE|nr:hypothetical protein [Phenylobacterium sp.]THD52658.1 MAG: hypothetical protein E8A12_19535 [Phenylobacterium sp.]
MQTRDYNFAAKYSEAGREVSVAQRYRCFLENQTWLSEAGPTWHTRSPAEQAIRLKLASGQPAVIQPLPRTASTTPECPEKDGALPSALFVALPDARGLAGFDSQNTDRDGATIRLLSIEVKRLGSGEAAFKETPTTPDPRQFFYTVSGAFFQGHDIDRMGLRDYVKARHSIWVTPGSKWRFAGWTPEDVQAARTLGKPQLYNPQDGLGIPGAWSDGHWTLSDTPSHEAMTWFRLAKSVALPEPDASLPRTQVRYRDFEFELPTGKYSGFHFYDPASDELIVLYLVRLQAVSP